jgi:hypothetical protein
MLDDLELPQVQEIRTHELRSLAEHKPPGMAGSFLQNLGRRPTLLLLWGVASGAGARAFLAKLEAKFRAGKPVPFTADIVTDSTIEKVLVEDLKLDEIAGRPERFTYVLTLRELIEPVAPSAAGIAGAGLADLAALDSDLLAEAAKLTGDLVAGLVAGRELVDALTRFVPQFTDLLARLRQLGSSH